MRVLSAAGDVSFRAARSGRAAKAGLHERFGIVGARQADCRSLVDQSVLLILLGAEHVIESRHGSLCFLGVKQQQLGLGELHIGEAQVEIGAEICLGERADLIDGGLALGDGFLRNFDTACAVSA